MPIPIISTVGIVYATGKLLENFAIDKLDLNDQHCAERAERHSFTRLVYTR